MKKAAFTLLELIFTLVILGIVGVMSSEIIAKVYENFRMQRESANLAYEAKVVLDQVETYLNRAIPGSIVCRQADDTLVAIEAKSVCRANATSNERLLWIDRDFESIQGLWDGVALQNVPAVSGYYHGSSEGLEINGTDSDTRGVAQVRDDIYGREVSAVYFPGKVDGDVEEQFWQLNAQALFQVTSFENDRLFVNRDINDSLRGVFYITHSAYGIESNDKNLSLLYNFHPWLGDHEDFNATKRLLVSDFSSFEAWSENQGRLLRIKLCLERPLSLNDGTLMKICKESVVY